MSFKGKIAHYLGLSTEKGIITEKQKSEILELVAAESGNFGFFRILAIFGVLCIGIGILLVIASNWSNYPNILQLLLALALPILFLGIGYYLSYIRRELSILGTAFVLTGGLSIGGTIALIGQIYHIGGNVGGILLVWCLLTIPLVFVFRLKVLSFLSIILFYVTAFYFLIDTYREGEIIFSFAILGSIMTIGAYIVNQLTQKKVHYLLYPIIVVSLKVVLCSLFLGTFDFFIFSFSFFSSAILQNVLFLVVTLGIMWWANNSNEIVLRHTTFFWLGLYLVVKYFTLFEGYLSAGVFFISGGIFMIAVVYSFIKINKFLGKKKIEDQNTL